MIDWCPDPLIGVPLLSFGSHLTSGTGAHRTCDVPCLILRSGADSGASALQILGSRDRGHAAGSRGAALNADTTAAARCGGRGGFNLIWTARRLGSCITRQLAFGFRVTAADEGQAKGGEKGQSGESTHEVSVSDQATKRVFAEKSAKKFAHPL